MNSPNLDYKSPCQYKKRHGRTERERKARVSLSVIELFVFATRPLVPLSHYASGGRDGLREVRNGRRLTKAPTAVRNCDCIAWRLVNPLRTKIE